jgi:hypothetical protein
MFKSRIFLFLALIVLLIVGLRVASNRSKRSSSVPALGNSSVPSLLLTDCLAASSDCPEISIKGDAPATFPNGTDSSFRGYADPSIRKDPNSNRLWMTYSWTSIHFESLKNHVPMVDIHLSYSDDGGKTWHYQGPLWSAYKDTNKGGDQGVGYTSVEVSNILPIITEAGTTWIGARAEYFLPMPGGFQKRDPDSIRLLISKAPSLPELRSGPFVTIGTDHTSKAWGIDMNLSALSPELKKCYIWNEPALTYDNGTLYMALECLQRSGTKLGGSIVVFSTKPLGDVKSWKWQYNGELAGSNEGNELGGEGVTQVELAKGVDGKLLAILSPEENQTNHMGCRVVEVDSLEKPKLARVKEKLVVRSTITASDLGKAGPGACAYDPASATGVIVVRRMLENKEFVTTLNATGLKP